MCPRWVPGGSGRGRQCPHTAGSRHSAADPGNQTSHFICQDHFIPQNEITISESLDISSQF